MINLLLGPPGGGKSYEATVYHIVPALTAGRKVITNLPLDLDRLAQIDPHFPALVQKVDNRRGITRSSRRVATLGRFSAMPAEPEEGIIRAFSTMEDYADPWRHPQTGAGPLYVIDECHLALPRGDTAIEVEEWYSLHRHESADVLLITQSYGKVSKSIIDLVQVCYRVKKATAFGTAKKYIRKVQDGVRGEVVNTSIRQYEKRFFGLYVSHTRGGGSELAAQDIVPFWQRWPFLALGLCIIILVGLLLSGVSLNPLKSAKASHTAKVEPVAVPVAAKPVQVVEETVIDGQVVSHTSTANKKPAGPPPQDVEAKGTPFEGHKLHIIGSVRRAGKVRMLFAVSEGDRYKMDIDSTDLAALGYEIEFSAPCAVHLKHGAWSKWAICDAPLPERLPGGAYDLPDQKRDGGGSRVGGPPPSGGDPSLAPLPSAGSFTVGPMPVVEPVHSIPG